MKPRTIFLVFMLLALSKGNSKAQGDFQFWFTYLNQTRLSQKWGYTFDLNYRTRGFFPFQSNLAAARGGVVYFLGDHWRFSSGYAWFGTNLNQKNIDLLHEHRLWQQALWVKKNRNIQIFHRIRLEERFRQFQDFVPKASEGLSFTMRYRYMFQAQGPLLPPSKPKGFQLGWQAANEILFQTGDLTGSRAFNQNRTLAGLLISPNRNLDLAVLYQFILQYQPADSEFDEVHSVRLTLVHQLDLR